METASYVKPSKLSGLMESILPTFWSTELSHAFATNDSVFEGTRLPKEVTKEDKKTKAKELRKKGFSYRKIANMLNINEGTAYNYVNDYPYKR